jgi:hypothetical protein
VSELADANDAEKRWNLEESDEEGEQDDEESDDETGARAGVAAAGFADPVLKVLMCLVCKARSDKVCVLLASALLCECARRSLCGICSIHRMVTTHVFQWLMGCISVKFCALARSNGLPTTR